TDQKYLFRFTRDHSFVSLENNHSPQLSIDPSLNVSAKAFAGSSIPNAIVVFDRKIESKANYQQRLLQSCIQKVFPHYIN
ncbi:MAG: hypothetical protein IPO85_00405, partial [Saprospiraceae bacterium]|nr:hypothetical protein [Candidatus Defluviibacterium haderslevense]